MMKHMPKETYHSSFYNKKKMRDNLSAKNREIEK